GDVAVLHEQDLDVLPADVADDIDVAEEAHGAHHVRDRLDDVDVGTHALLEHVSGVARRSESDALENGALILDVGAKLQEQLLRVLDGVALRELVGLAYDGALLVDEHRFRGGGTAVEADDGADRLSALELHRGELGDGVDLLELLDLVVGAN